MKTLETCARCQREKKCASTKHGPGRYCEACVVMLATCAREGRPCPPWGSKGKRPATPASAAKKAKATPGKIAAELDKTIASLEAAVKREPPLIVNAPAPTAVPTAIETGHANGRAVVLIVTCYEIGQLRAALAGCDGLDVRLGGEA